MKKNILVIGPGHVTNVFVQGAKDLGKDVSVTSFNQGIDALNRLKSSKFDLIICDDHVFGEQKSAMEIFEEANQSGIIGESTGIFVATSLNYRNRIMGILEQSPDNVVIKGNLTIERAGNNLKKFFEIQDVFLPVYSAYDKKDYKRAIEEIKKLQQNPEVKKYYNFELTRLYLLSLFGNKSYSQIIEYYKKIEASTTAENREKDYVWLQFLYAQSLYYEGFLSKARDVCKTISEKNPHFMKNYDFYARILSESGDMDTAREVLNIGFEKSPNNLARQQEIVEVAMAQGDTQYVKAHLENILKNSQHSGIVSVDDYANMALLELKEDNPAKALEIAEKMTLKFSARSGRPQLTSQAKLIKPLIEAISAQKNREGNPENMYKDFKNTIKGGTRGFTPGLKKIMLIGALQFNDTSFAEELYDELNDSLPYLSQQIHTLAPEKRTQDKMEQLTLRKEKSFDDFYKEIRILCQEKKRKEASLKHAQKIKAYPNEALSYFTFCLTKVFYLEDHINDNSIKVETRQEIENLYKEGSKLLPSSEYENECLTYVKIIQTVFNQIKTK